MKSIFRHKYNSIISIENILNAWQGFVKGKRNRKDVQVFEQRLMKNIILLHNDLNNDNYEHSKYESFNISDPKPRNINKASVRDRLLHHLIHQNLYYFFDRTFISDSYSCRLNKGTHKALNQFRNYACKVSKSHTKTCWVLKCDIKKFFASIDHVILKHILGRYIEDHKLLRLLYTIIDSFCVLDGKGLPLGNLTSQLLVNIYMNEFDQFMKHRIKAKDYVRYADDFVILSTDKGWLLEVLPEMESFLLKKLKLRMHPNKVSIKTYASGVDFLGWVNFTDHRVLRTTTKRRIFSALENEQVKDETIQSCLGVLRHGNTKKIQGQFCLMVGKKGFFGDDKTSGI
ncbi:MAG: reverse transcriptase/maturase family protein [Candidatus Paceibacterota bacterium]